MLKPRYLILIFTFLSLNSSVIFCQDFGYFEVNPTDSFDLDYYSRESGALYDSFSIINWDNYNLTVTKDGYYKEYYFTINSDVKRLKMEGEIKSGRMNGKWTFYDNISPSFYSGEISENNKEGLWLGFFVNLNSDTICIDTIYFVNDNINGQRTEYFTNGLIFRETSYLNGLKHGTQYKYSVNDSTHQSFISEIRNYKNDLLDGLTIDYSFRNPFDTVKMAEYSQGKLNGLLYTKSYYTKEKTFIHYSNNQLHGRLTIINPNGTVQFDLELKNNLPFTLYSNNDIEGHPLDTNKFINGNGILNIYYGNGKLKSSFQYKNQLVNGPYLCYDYQGNITENGVLIATTDSVYSKFNNNNNISDINFHSIWQMRFLAGSESVFYNSDGTISQIGTAFFDDSLLTDVMQYKVYDKNSILITETNYAYRLKYGPSIEYYENGNIKKIEHYKIATKNDTVKSLLDGKCTYYNDSGNIHAEVKYKQGEEVGKSYYYNNNSKLIRTKIIEDDGSVYNIFIGDTVNFTDKNGLKQGKWISLDYSSYTNFKYPETPEKIKYYTDGKPIGTWQEYFYKKNKLSQEIVWVNDSIAYCKSWFPNGKLSSEGYLLNIESEGLSFVQDGLWKKYKYKSGRLLLEGKYLWGEKIGVWYEYDRKGKVCDEIDYKEGLTKNYW